MTGILGRSNAKQSNVAASLRYQTAQKGGVIPLVYGTARLAVNLLDYQNFKSSGGSTGKGGSGSKVAGKSGSQTLYSVDFTAGVCQGPIANWGLLWYNKTVRPCSAGPGFRFPRSAQMVRQTILIGPQNTRTTQSTIRERRFIPATTTSSARARHCRTSTSKCSDCNTAQHQTAVTPTRPISSSTC